MAEEGKSLILEVIREHGPPLCTAEVACSSAEFALLLAESLLQVFWESELPMREDLSQSNLDKTRLEEQCEVEPWCDRRTRDLPHSASGTNLKLRENI